MNNTKTNEQLRQELLEKCFELGLPANSSDDINTLKMYLSVDSKLDDIVIDLTIDQVEKNKDGLISQILKLLPVRGRNRRPVLLEG
jgi:hypothetical protein